MREKVCIRGLSRLVGWIFCIWGSWIFVAGLYHAFIGEPEANFYSPAPWDFVSQEEWLRWSGFEVAYGLFCLGLGFLAFAYARRLPEWIVREKKPATSFFD